MKKEIVGKYRALMLGILFISMFVLSINFVAAEETAVDAAVNFVTGSIDFLQRAGDPIFRALFGSTELAGAGLFLQILVFALVVFVIFSVLDVVNISDNDWINWGIGAIVAIIGIRFMPPGLLETMALPSTAFVAAIVLVIPFILVGMIVFRFKDFPAVRKGLWIGYAVIVIILGIYNYQETGAGWVNWYWIYFWIAVACVVAFWFDGTLQKWVRNAGISGETEKVTNVELERAMARMDDLKARLGRASNKGQRVQIERAIHDQEEAIKALRSLD